MNEVILVVNDEGHSCKRCHEVHDFLTRNVEGVDDSCHVPVLFDKDTIQELLDENGLFMGGRPFAVEVLNKKGIQDA